ncbi:MAG TPA: ABC transporter substrate-binding protein [Ktedonobacterales bacterium]|nr:ABC transporter substrate-binding protein [Ktedonobacterales bacterium]
MRTHPPTFLSIKKRSVFLALLALSMMLAACGSTTNKGPTRNYLTIVANQTDTWTDNFNPYFDATSNVIASSEGLIYEPLLFFNKFNAQYTGMLASGYTVSSDGKQITFNLRQGVQWSDGKPFTSADVLFTFNMLKKYSGLDVNGLWTLPIISNVTAPDPSTVIVTLASANNDALFAIGDQTWIVSQHIWSTVGDPTNYADTSPVGTGPYMVESFTPQLIKMKKNPHYWQPGLPKVQEIRFPAYKDNSTAELAMDQGQVDWNSIFAPNLQNTYVKRDPSHNHYWFPPSDVLYILVNLKKSPFDLLAVRQAISLAINRQQWSTIAESGYETPASPTGLLPLDNKYLDPTYQGLSFSVDTNKAMQLLESVGFHKGSDGIYADAKGNKLSFNFEIPSGYTDWVAGAPVITSDLKAIGIEINVKTVSTDVFTTDVQNGNFDITMQGTISGPSPYNIYSSLLLDTNSAPIGQSANGDYERWSDPTTDQLLNQFITSTDPAVQQQAMSGLEKILVDQVPAIPLTNEPYWYEYNSTNFTGWPDQTHEYALPSPYQYPDDEIVLLHLQPA